MNLKHFLITIITLTCSSYSFAKTDSATAEDMELYIHFFNIYEYVPSDEPGTLGKHEIVGFRCAGIEAKFGKFWDVPVSIWHTNTTAGSCKFMDDGAVYLSNQDNSSDKPDNSAILIGWIEDYNFDDLNDDKGFKMTPVKDLYIKNKRKYKIEFDSNFPWTIISATKTAYDYARVESAGKSIYFEDGAPAEILWHHSIDAE